MRSHLYVSGHLPHWHSTKRHVTFRWLLMAWLSYWEVEGRGVELQPGEKAARPETTVHLYICKNETAGCLEWDITVFQAKNQIFSTWTSPDCYSVMIYNSGVTLTLWGDNMSALPSWSFLSSLIKHCSAEAVCIFYNVGIFLQHELNMSWITEELHDVSDTSTHHMHTYIHARIQSCSSWSCVCGAACSRPLLQHINREQNIRPLVHVSLQGSQPRLFNY